MSLDPEKLQAALEALEAEKERRDEEKIASGEAVVHVDVCTPGNEDHRTHDDSGRELIHLRVYTGVPRGVDDDDTPSEPQTPAKREPWSHQRYAPVRPNESEPEPEPITSPPIFVRVQIEAPNDRNPGGRVAEAIAHIEMNGTMTVRDRYTGSVIGTTSVKAGDDFAAAARRLILRQRGPSDFWRSLQ